MKSVDDRLAALGVQVPELLLPGADVDLSRWAVIACDQHTSEPEYWEEVEAIVGEAPSTLRLVFPEVYLGETDADLRVRSIREAMDRYLAEGTLREAGRTMILTRRETPRVADRRGLILALDLDAYDYHADSTSLIRATEETIEDRLPPRVRIREAASIELPHILVLIDDPDDALIGGILNQSLDPLYETSLMKGGGVVRGFAVPEQALEGVAATLEALRDASRSDPPFLFAMGDGNHSLATAKQVWERENRSEAPNLRARYALAELVNIYDPGLIFEPIHRLILGGEVDGFVERVLSDNRFHCEPLDEPAVRESVQNGHAFGLISESRSFLVRVKRSEDLPVAVIQEMINASEGFETDYIHGWGTALRLGRKRQSAALLMPPFERSALYPYLETHGVLPRKAFSLGEAEEKRYYLEARRIS